MKTKAAVCREWGEPLSIEEIELEAPKEHEVLVKLVNNGWCHSDLSAWKGHFGIDILPFVIGHECAGIVQEVGPEVTNLKPGDHVVSCWVAPCGTCEQCVNGRTHLCEMLLPSLGSGKLLDGTARFKDADGSEINHHLYVSGFSEYIVTPDISSVKIPDELPFEQACLLGCCVCTGWGAVNRAAKVQAGMAVAVWGMGGVGLSIVRGAALAGANPIIAIDLEDSKEEIAREMGATHFINNSENDPVPIIKDITDGKGAHRVFEAIGDPGAYAQAWFAVRLSGKLMAVGIPPVGELVSFPVFMMPFQGTTMEGVLYGNVRHTMDIPVLANMALRGDLKLDKLVTKHFRLEDINDVAQAMEDRQIVGRWVCDFD